MTTEIAKRILFTGAGFTKNFGGFLATDMWSEIFNRSEIQSQPRLRELLLSDFHYESLYYKVLSGAYDEGEKNAVSTAVLDAYRSLDDVVREWTSRRDAQYPVNIYGVNELIEAFPDREHPLAYFFTVNQDLFIERHFRVRTAFGHPCLGRMLSDEIIQFRFPLNNEHWITLPTQHEIKARQANWLSHRGIYYVKLHGSYGWRGSDGSNRLVIGHDKEGQIASEPLLSWYLGLFKQTLCRPDVKLLIIGYGFRDQHINEIIAESITKHGLKLYVISPSDPSDFRKELRDKPCGEKLWEGLSGYYPHDLLHIFPGDQTETHIWIDIRRDFFEVSYPC